MTKETKFFKVTIKNSNEFDMMRRWYYIYRELAFTVKKRVSGSGNEYYEVVDGTFKGKNILKRHCTLAKEPNKTRKVEIKDFQAKLDRIEKAVEAVLKAIRS